MENLQFAEQLVPAFAPDKVAVRLGGRKNRRLSYATRHKVHLSREKLRDLLQPRFTYQIKAIQDNYRGRIILNDQTEFRSPKLARTLKESSQLVCFVATIGRGIEREIKKLMHLNQLSEAYILDAMGSVAIEDMVEKFQTRMTAELGKKRLKSTLRFSPGYCDWPITQQQQLFALLNTDDIGVKLTDSCLMSPRKSISGVFGITSRKADPYNPCGDCRKTGCEARRSRPASG